jgi:hypothetical protein
MALVVHTQPQTLTPAYNQQIFTALSDQYAVNGFKYKVEVVVNSDTANTYTEYILPRPDGWLVFDAQQWVKNYIEHYFELANVVLANPINLATNKSVSVDVTISEFGVSPFDSVPLNYNAFDACLTDKAFRNYDYTDYIFNGTAGKYFLSKTVDTITPDPRVTLNQLFFIHFINTNATPINNINIKLFRGITLIETVIISTIPTPVTPYDIYQLFLGSQIFSLGALVGDTVKVNFNNGSPLVSLLEYEFTYQSICTKYTDYTLHYLDRDGNILFFHFEYKSSQNFVKKVNTVTLNKNVLNTTTGVYSSNSYDREENIVSTAIESTLVLNSGWITEAQSLQLKDLFDSPIVYLWDGTELLSCRVTNTSYDKKIRVNDKLFNYEVTIDLGITETRQRGI